MEGSIKLLIEHNTFRNNYSGFLKDCMDAFATRTVRLLLLPILSILIDLCSQRNVKSCSCMIVMWLQQHGQRSVDNALFGDRKHDWFSHFEISPHAGGSMHIEF